MKKAIFVLSAVMFYASANAQKPAPKAPPPPPIVTDAPPSPSPPKVSIETFTPPAELAINAENEYKAFLKKNPSVKNLSWSNRGSRVVIVLKSGKTEVYDLENEKDAQKLKQKYGTLPIAPPPPPPVPEVIKG
jgi:hypothetical protein